MTLEPLNSPCAACLSLEASFRFCAEDCDEVSPGKFETAARIGEDVGHPHLHRVCSRCGYEWLERCLGLRGTEGVA